MAKKRIDVFYSGRVQGVGFRFTVELAARQLDLVGWVKNLRDGKVEVVCEGEEEKLQELLDEIKNSALQPHINDIDLKWSEAVGGLSGFEIRLDT